MNLKTLMALMMALSVILGACGSTDDAAASVVLQCRDAESSDNLDADGDDYTPCEGDYDDNDPNASPGDVEESETDGYDQDCDNFTFTSG
jgi:hypothetical protein